MGIKGTVKRSTDGDFIHANVDIDLIITEEPEIGNIEKPVEIFHIIEHFCLGRRRLHLFGRDSTIRPGRTAGDKGTVRLLGVQGPGARPALCELALRGFGPPVHAEAQPAPAAPVSALLHGPPLTPDRPPLPQPHSRFPPSPLQTLSTCGHLHFLKSTAFSIQKKSEKKAHTPGSTKVKRTVRC